MHKRLIFLVLIFAGVITSNAQDSTKAFDRNFFSIDVAKVLQGNIHLGYQKLLFKNIYLGTSFFSGYNPLNIYSFHNNENTSFKFAPSFSLGGGFSLQYLYKNKKRKRSGLGVYYKIGYAYINNVEKEYRSSQFSAALNRRTNRYHNFIIGAEPCISCNTNEDIERRNHDLGITYSRYFDFRKTTIELFVFPKLRYQNSRYRMNRIDFLPFENEKNVITGGFSSDDTYSFTYRNGDFQQYSKESLYPWLEIGLKIGL